MPLYADGLAGMCPPTPTMCVPPTTHRQSNKSISWNYHKPPPQLIMCGLMTDMSEVIFPYLFHNEIISQLDNGVNLKLLLSY
jgi:hypothetical protein